MATPTFLRDSYGEVRISFWFTLIAVVIFGPLIAWAVHESERPSFELKKDDWHCTAFNTESHLTQVGKVMVPTSTQVCTQWTRK